MPPAAKPMGEGKETASPRASKPKDGKKAAAKKKVPTAPVSLGMPMNKAADLTEDQAKSDLEELQKKYGALVVNFNNQQSELKMALSHKEALEAKVEELQAAAQAGAPPVTEEGAAASLKKELESAQSEIRSLEASNMALQKKVNKLQVEHVSEEEVDQLFYALEVKEKELDKAIQDKAVLEQEVLTARQLSARGGGADSKFIEIHHHNDCSDDDDDDPPPAEAPAVAAS